MITQLLLTATLILSSYVTPVRPYLGDDMTDEDFKLFIEAHGDIVEDTIDSIIEVSDFVYEHRDAILKGGAAGVTAYGMKFVSLGPAIVVAAVAGSGSELVKTVYMENVANKDASKEEKLEELQNQFLILQQELIAVNQELVSVNARLEAYESKDIKVSTNRGPFRDEYKTDQTTKVIDEIIKRSLAEDKRIELIKRNRASETTRPEQSPNVIKAKTLTGVELLKFYNTLTDEEQEALSYMVVDTRGPKTREADRVQARKEWRQKEIRNNRRSTTTDKSKAGPYRSEFREYRDPSTKEVRDKIDRASDRATGRDSGPSNYVEKKSAD